MKTWMKLAGVCGLLLAPGLCLAEAGTVSYVEGKVFKVAGGKGDKKPLDEGDKVDVKDVLITGAGGEMGHGLIDALARQGFQQQALGVLEAADEVAGATDALGELVADLLHCVG